MKTETDIKIEQLHNKVRGLLNSGMGADEIIATLKREGIDPAYTILIIQNIKSDNRDKMDFWKLIFMGSFFIIGGSLINYFSYRIAARANSTFFYLYWGIVVVGAIMIIRAFSLYRKHLFKH
jgi:hypothetical protein